MSDKAMMRVMLKSVYLPYEPADGARYLAETLWPEGVDTQRLSPYLWLHELAPSYELKEMALWQHWETGRFRDEYKRELQEPQRRTWFDLVLDEARNKGVTLLHRSDKHDWQVRPEDTSVYYLKEFLIDEINAGGRGPELELAAKGVDKTKGVSKKAIEQWLNEGGR